METVIHILKTLFLICFIISLLGLSGFIARILTGYSKSEGLYVEEKIVGFTIISLLCLGSLILFDSLIIGGIIGTCISLISFFYVVKNNKWKFKMPTLNGEMYIKLSFITILLAVFTPSIFGQGIYFKLPNIFDLSKHLSSVIALANASSWPPANPYYPDGYFLYNVLFYTPIGLISKLSTFTGSYIIAYCIMLIWVCWQAMNVFLRISQLLNFSKPVTLIGLLLMTFIGGITPLFVESDFPRGYLLHEIGLSNFWSEDPFTNFIYVPQHILAIVCLQGSWIIIIQDSIKINGKLVLLNILIAGGCLCSYILAPIFLIVYAAIIFYLIITNFKKTKKNILKITFSTIIFLSAIFPILLQASQWSSSEEKPAFFDFQALKGWYIVIISTGPIGLLTILGLVIVLLSYRKIETKWWLYLLLVLFPILCLILFRIPDFGLNTTLLLRFISVPVACLGINFLYIRFRLKFVSVGLIISAYIVLINSIYFGHIIVSAYQPRTENEKSLISSLREIPKDKTIFIATPNQELAAVSGHLVYMDFRGYRNDSYLPYFQRDAAANYFSKSKLQDFDINNIDNIVISGNESDYIVNENINISYFDVVAPIVSESERYRVYRSDHESKKIQQNLVFSKNSLKWEFWSSSKDVANDITKLTISSEGKPVDAALLAPITLEQGTYIIEASISGVIVGPETGAAHISLHGKEKLISIVSGNYELQTFTKILTVGKEGFNGSISIGLGGWSTGSGHLTINDLKINKLVPLSIGGFR